MTAVAGHSAASAPGGGLRADVRIRLGDLDLRAAVNAEPGQVVAVLGPNGAGKSTLLRSLAGLQPLTGGALVVAGRCWDEPGRLPRPVPARHREVGLVLADPLLFPHLSVLENVAFGPRARGSSRPAARARARLELDHVGLAHLADARPRELSSGQAQRVSVARALAADPQLLLLDEPMAALDVATRSRMRAGLADRLSGYAGVTVVVTHDPLDALSLADQLVFLESGAIVQAGTPADVVSCPRDPYVAQVVGLNLLAGTATGSSRVALPGGSIVVGEAPSAGPVWVTFPPSAVAVHRTRPDGSPRNVWQLEVEALHLEGQRTRVTLAGSPGLVAEVTPAAVEALRLAPGQHVYASVKATEVSAYPATDRAEPTVHAGRPAVQPAG